MLSASSFNDVYINVFLSFANLRDRYQKETEHASLFVNVKIKIYYDSCHTLLRISFEEKTFLRLNHDYRLFEKFNVKLFNQRINSFLIKSRIERLIYELKLLSQ